MGAGGKRLALATPHDVGDESRRFRLAITDLDGELFHLHQSGFISDVAWSRQGRLAWTAMWERVGNGLWVGDTAGRGTARIAKEAYSVSWSPDGSRMAFLGGQALNVIDADGGRRRVLTRACAIGSDDEGGVAWSPDGREIACHSRRGSLVVLNLVTMRLRKVATWRRFGDGSVGDISWQAR